MKFRLAKESDQDEIYRLFVAAQITASDVAENPGKKSGFFEYDLTHQDVVERTQTPLSLVVEGARGELLGYLSGYSTTHLDSFSSHDVVHEALAGCGTTAYIDQLCLGEKLSLPVGMRLFDTWDALARESGIKYVTCAIPQKPWLNVSSTRMIAYRGFRRTQMLISDSVNLGLFEKPYVNLG